MNAGIREYRGVEAGPAEWDGIISEDLYRQVRDRLRGPRRLSHRGSKPKWLLSGTASCGVCGGKVRRGNNRGYDNYVCGESFCVARRVSRLDAYVGEVPINWFRQPEAQDLFAPSVADAEDEAVTVRQRAQQEVDELQSTLDGWVDASISGTVPAGNFAKIEAGLIAKIEAAQRNAEPPRAFSARVRNLVEADDPAARWADLPLVARKEVNAELLDIRIKRSYQRTRDPDPDSVRV